MTKRIFNVVVVIGIGTNNTFGESNKGMEKQQESNTEVATNFTEEIKFLCIKMMLVVQKSQ